MLLHLSIYPSIVGFFSQLGTVYSQHSRVQNDCFFLILVLFVKIWLFLLWLSLFISIFVGHKPLVYSKSLFHLQLNNLVQFSIEGGFEVVISMFCCSYALQSLSSGSVCFSCPYYWWFSWSNSICYSLVCQMPYVSMQLVLIMKKTIFNYKLNNKKENKKEEISP